MNFDFLNPLINGVMNSTAPIPQVQPMNWMTPGFNPNAPIVGTHPQLPSSGIQQPNQMGWLARMNANPNAWSALGEALMAPNQVTVGSMGSLITQDPGLGARIGAGFASAEKAIQTNEDRALAKRNAELEQQMKQEQIAAAKTTNQSLGELKQLELASKRTENEMNQQKLEQARKTVDIIVKKLQADADAAELGVSEGRLTLSEKERLVKRKDKVEQLYPDLVLQADLEEMKAPIEKNKLTRAQTAQVGTASAQNVAETSLLGSKKKEQDLTNAGLEAIPVNERGRIKQSSSMSSTEQAIANRMEVWGSTRPEPTDAKGKAQWLRERANAAAAIRKEEYARTAKTGGATGGGLNSTALKAAETILLSPKDYSPEAVANAKATMEQAVNIPRVALPKVNSSGTESTPKASAVKKFTRDPKTGKIVLAK